MITTIDQRTFYPDGYNPITTMTMAYNEKSNIKYWLSKTLNIPINEIISPKILMKILRDYQNILPKQILPKIGKIISNPNSLFYTYLKSMMLFDYNPGAMFTNTSYSLFEENNFKDIFNKAVQKYMDPVSYLYATQIIFLLTLTETRIQIMKRHKESNMNFLKTFEELIGYEIVFNSSPELSVINLKELAGEIEYVAMAFIKPPDQEKNETNKMGFLPTIILKVPEGVILFNTPHTIRSLSERLDQTSTSKSSFSNIITSPPTGELTSLSDTVIISPEEKETEEDTYSSSNYEKIKKVAISEQKENFIVSGNLQLGMSVPDEQFPPSP